MKKTDTTKRVQEKRKGFTKKIGNTTYDVSFHYSRQSVSVNSSAHRKNLSPVVY